MTTEIIPGYSRLVNNQTRIENLQRVLSSQDHNSKIVPGSLRTILAEGSWLDRIDPDRGGKRWTFAPEEFIKFIRAPFPDGLHTHEDVLRRYLGEGTEERILFEEAIARCPGAPVGNQNAAKQDAETNPNNVRDCLEDGVRDRSGEPKAGNSLGYAVRRLSRERPDLLERVKQGELSCHRAMIEAGFRRELTPPEIGRKAYLKMNTAEREAFLVWANQIGW